MYPMYFVMTSSHHLVLGPCDWRLASERDVQHFRYGKCTYVVTSVSVTVTRSVVISLKRGVDMAHGIYSSPRSLFFSSLRDAKNNKT